MDASPSLHHAARGVRQNLPVTQLLIGPFVVLAGAGAIVLFLLPGATDRFFAWTLTPEPSAMFMGAGYAAGVVLSLLSFRRHPWAVTRTAALTILVFVVTMLATTLLHLERMHFESEVATARAAAWIWLVVYVVITPALLAVIIRQERLPGADPVRSRTMPRSLRLALLVFGVGLIVVGAALFAVPASMDAVWPWPITALAGRALSAWVLAIGFAALWVNFEHDLDRTRPAAITFAILGVLWLVTAIRGSGDVRWQRPSAWLYVGGAVFAVVVGLWGWWLATGTPSGE